MGGDDVLAGGEGIDQLYGGDGVDELYGGDGDDFLSGDFLDNVAPGDDVLYGEAGADFLIGAVGNDVLDGGEGDDALQGGQGQDVLFGGSGVDLLFGQEGEDLLVGDEGNDSLSGGEGNDTLFGDDGNDTLLGEQGNDTIFGGAGDDGLRGGIGDDVLDGGAGNDFYVFHLGDGHDVISDGTGSQALNELVFGPGISFGNLSFANNPLQQSLTIQINGGSDSIELLGVDLNNVAGTTPVKLLEFADGSQFALADQLPLASGLIEGDEGDEIIRTGPGDDVVDAQAGNDRVFAGAGHDFLVGGSGIDTLLGEAGDDRLIGGIGGDQLFGGSGNDSIEGAAGYDYVEGGEGNDTIYGGTEDDFLFGDQNPNSAPPNSPMNGGDDVVDGEEGNDDLRGGMGNDTLLGGLGDDLLFGEEGDDTLDGGPGDDLRLDGGPGVDVIHGGKGNDRLFAGFRSGGGGGEGDGDGIFVAPSSPSSGVDQLFGDEGDDYLDSGSENFDTEDSMLVGGDGSDTFIVDSVADTAIEAAGSGIDTVESFVSYTLPDNVENLVIAGVSGVLGTGNALDNVMRGFGQGTLDGRAGNDTLIDAQTYLFERGGGQDTIVENDTSSAPYFPGGAQDTIRMAAGITPADVSWQRSGNDLILKINGTTDQVAIPSYYNIVFNQGDYRFSPNLYFPGTTINVSTLPYYVAPSQIEVVQFTDGAIWGPGAFDAIQLGSFYPNVYTFGRGDGQDRIIDFDFTVEQPIDILQMKTGVSLDDVTYHRAGDDLVLGITGTTDQLTVQSHFASVFVLPPFAASGRTVKVYQLDQIRFADGTVMEAPVIGTEENDFLQGTGNDNVILGLGGEDSFQGLLGNDRIEGGPGDDYLEGNEGNDILDGEEGADTLFGGAGHDTYLFNLGDGIDTIEDISVVGEGNRIRFGAGIVNTDLTFTHDQVAQTLTIQVGSGGADKLVLTSFDPTRTNGSLVVSALEFADNTVVQLVDLYPPNQAPTLSTPLADQTVPEGEPLSIQVPANTFVDQDGGDVLTLSASLADGAVLPAWLTFDAVAGTFGGTADDAQVGSLDLKVIATDRGNESVADVFRLTVENVNEAPTVAIPLAAQTAIEDGLFTFTVPEVTFADVDQVHGDTLIYNASLAGGGTLPGWLSFDATTRTFSGTPGNKDVGSVTLTATATDTGNLSISTGFTLTVQNVNDAPTVAIPVADQNAAEDSPFSLTIPSTTFTDPDLIHGDGLTYSATLADGSSLPPWLNFNPTTRTLSGMPSPGDASTLQLAVTATDQGNLSATDLFALTISGPLPQTLFGTPGDDVLTGGRGDDTLSGLAGNDQINGGEGDDWLDGGTGTDTMIGNSGNDTYAIGESGDVVIEAVGEGTDTVQSSVTHTLGTNVENLTLTGSANLNGTGNALDNILTGNSGINVLTGGAGNDTYVVGPGDTVVENAGGGTDTVHSSVAWALSLNVENLTLTGAANISGIGSSANNVLIGNNGNNILAGGSGNDTMVGGEGNDSLLGGSGNDRLVGGLGDDMLNAGSGDDLLDGGDGVDNLDGGSGDDQLVGGAGKDSLMGGSGADQFTGGTGNDTLIGGSGNDVYYFSRGDGQDTINDFDPFPGNQDRALFGATINPLDLVISRQANDLRLAIHGSSETVAVTDWYLSNNNRVETIQAGNGDVLLSTQVDQLIEAMAAFSQQTGLTWDQAIDQRPQEVEAILAGSWQ
jgi:Ca2+-binding RTX toxin-like protein